MTMGWGASAPWNLLRKHGFKPLPDRHPEIAGRDMRLIFLFYMHLIVVALIATPSVRSLIAGTSFLLIALLLRWSVKRAAINKSCFLFMPRRPLMLSTMLGSTGLALMSGNPWYVLLAILVLAVIGHREAGQSESLVKTRLPPLEAHRHLQSTPIFLPSLLPSYGNARGLHSWVDALSEAPRGHKIFLILWVGVLIAGFHWSPRLFPLRAVMVLLMVLVVVNHLRTRIERRR